MLINILTCTGQSLTVKDCLGEMALWISFEYLRSLKSQTKELEYYLVANGKRLKAL